eukprot:TRINITY_DN12600_c0_g2_i1.p1 TRINITY_DN12600_c0_g2~~TRINITY_DN12600_c0_g2_i1.p1  ORF type:complete len:416 (+),score=69.01 TRINITY_DN12600_c0_g2_i1:51-1250(+)
MAETTQTIEELQKKLEEMTKERDAWKEKAVGFPATSYPKREWLQGKITYPEYVLDDRRGSFLKIRDFLIDELCADLKPGYEVPEKEVDRVRKMLKYNLEGGKMNRGMMVVEAGLEIFKSKGIPVHNDALCKFAILGWCIEWLQAWLLIADDIMDDSKTRRGQPCWYLTPHVGNIAINDAFLVEMMTFKILKRHFSSEPFYTQLLDLFLETTFQTECGQLLDTLCENLDMNDLTTQRWELIVKYKTAFYSFYIAVASGMILAGITDLEAFNSAREILIIMGVYFQAQDDYLDCYGTPEQIGKIGTDIQDRKCSWLFTHAYHTFGSQEDRAYLDEHYGRTKVNSPEEQAIKDLFTKLKLPELYKKYEEESYEKIMALKNTTKEVPWSVFEIFLAKIYKRTK